MSVSKNKINHASKIIYFHGQNVNSKKFQKKINRKNSLISVILVNAAIIFGLIVTIAIFAAIGG